MRTRHDLRSICRHLHYTWTSTDGTVHRGHTVVVAADRRRLKQALRDFWRCQPNVIPSKSRA